MLSTKERKLKLIMKELKDLRHNNLRKSYGTFDGPRDEGYYWTYKVRRKLWRMKIVYSGFLGCENGYSDLMGYASMNCHESKILC